MFHPLELREKKTEKSFQTRKYFLQRQKCIVLSRWKMFSSFCHAMFFFVLFFAFDPPNNDDIYISKTH